MGERDRLTLTLHGLDEFNQDVDGEVFARKLFKFMQGLAEADIAANGARRHRFLISDLKKNTATATVREQVTNGRERPRSGIDYYENGLLAIYNDAPAARQLPRSFVKYVVDINKDVGKTFPFGEIKREFTGTVIRIDEILEKRARRVLEDINRNTNGILSFYRGTAYGSFDGVLLLLDSLSGAERAVLVLTAGGKRINCNISGVDDEQLRRAWKRRCVVQGTAHYGGASGLPESVDVRHIRTIEAPGALDAWKGAFEIPAPEDDAWA